MLIRRAKTEDFEVWHKLRGQLWAHVGESENTRFLNESLENENSLILLAFADSGVAAGFLEGSIRTDYVEDCDTNWVGYIEGWFVAAEYRRQNVGRKLVEAAENWARARGCIEMASDCELDNAISLRAHLGTGYEAVSRNIHFKKML